MKEEHLLAIKTYILWIFTFQCTISAKDLWDEEKHQTVFYDMCILLISYLPHLHSKIMNI